MIRTAGVVLEGDLATVDSPSGVVLFAHGSGSSRHSPRNQMVARQLRDAGFSTLLVDLLTADEERAEERGATRRFDIELLAGRLSGIIDWLGGQPATEGQPVGLFGASTGAAAALVGAETRPEPVRAVVSRGGRPDLAGDALSRVRAPTLLIVGGDDPVVLELHGQAAAGTAAPCGLRVVPNGTRP